MLVRLLRNHPVLDWLSTEHPARFTAFVNKLQRLALPAVDLQVHLPYVNEAVNQRRREETLAAAAINAQALNEQRRDREVQIDMAEATKPQGV